MYQFTLLSNLFAKYPEVDDEKQQEVNVKSEPVVVNDTKPVKSATITDLIEFDTNLITYYRYVHDKEFQNLSKEFNLKNVYVTRTSKKSLSNEEQVCFNYEITNDDKIKDETQKILLIKLNELKQKLNIINLKINEKKIFNEINKLINDDNGLIGDYKLIMLEYTKTSPKESIVNPKIMGLKEDLNKFYNLYQKFIKVDATGTLWSIGENLSEKTPQKQPQQKQYQQSSPSQHQQQQQQQSKTKEREQIQTPSPSQQQQPQTPKQSVHQRLGNIVNASPGASSSGASSPLSVTINRDREKRTVTAAGDQRLLLECLICQNEDYSQLTKCSNPDCKTAFCKNMCLINFLKNQRSNKCPNCPWKLNSEQSGKF